MKPLKYALSALLILLVFGLLFFWDIPAVAVPDGTSLSGDLTQELYVPDSEVDYEEVQRQLNDLRRQMSAPVILKDDILRGWYMAAEDEKKYGTPNTWVFVEDGDKSMWISPNAMEDEVLFDERTLCRETAGTYRASCLDSTDEECEFVQQSTCHCLDGSKWKDEQGCILVSEKGSYISINSKELRQGYYYGLPNEKKLNTPSDWVWVEDGRESVWRNPN